MRRIKNNWKKKIISIWNITVYLKFWCSNFTRSTPYHIEVHHINFFAVLLNQFTKFFLKTKKIDFSFQLLFTKKNKFPKLFFLFFLFKKPKIFSLKIHLLNNQLFNQFDTRFHFFDLKKKNAVHIFFLFYIQKQYYICKM